MQHDFKEGDEIEYMPKNEWGFVTSIGAGVVFCRFYAKPGQFRSDFYGLRTVANSEACNPCDLRFVQSATSRTREIIEVMKNSPEKYGWPREP